MCIEDFPFYAMRKKVFRYVTWTYKSISIFILISIKKFILKYYSELSSEKSYSRTGSRRSKTLFGTDLNSKNVNSIGIRSVTKWLLPTRSETYSWFGSTCIIRMYKLIFSAWSEPNQWQKNWCQTRPESCFDLQKRI